MCTSATCSHRTGVSLQEIGKSRAQALIDAAKKAHERGERDYRLTIDSALGKLLQRQLTPEYPEGASVFTGQEADAFVAQVRKYGVTPAELRLAGLLRNSDGKACTRSIERRGDGDCFVENITVDQRAFAALLDLSNTQPSSRRSR